MSSPAAALAIKSALVEPVSDTTSSWRHSGDAAVTSSRNTAASSGRRESSAVILGGFPVEAIRHPLDQRQRVGWIVAAAGIEFDRDGSAQLAGPFDRRLGPRRVDVGVGSAIPDI